MKKKNAFNSPGFEKQNFAIDSLLIFLILSAAIQIFRELVWAASSNVTWLQFLATGLFAIALRVVLANGHTNETAEVQTVSTEYEHIESENFDWIGWFQTALKRVKVF